MLGIADNELSGLADGTGVGGTVTGLLLQQRLDDRAELDRHLVAQRRRLEGLATAVSGEYVGDTRTPVSELPTMARRAEDLFD